MKSKNYLPTLVVLFVAAFVSSYNENIINVALVDIMGEFAIDAGTAQWLVTGYMIVTSVIVTTMAFLSQRFSLRQLFFAACTFIVAGSALCYFAASFGVLLASRILQSFGTGILLPLMMGAVLATAPKGKLGSYLSVGSAAITLGPAFAPVLSGVMVTFFGWRSIFIPASAVTLAIVLAGIFLVRDIGETRAVHADVPSIVLSAIGLTFFVSGLGAITASILAACAELAVGIAAIAIFVQRQSKLEQPMLDLRPLRKLDFSLACILVIIAMMTTFSMSVLLPLYFEGALGETALVAGMLILPPIVVNAATAIAGGKVMDKHGAWPLLPAGFLLIAIGQLAAAFFGGSSALIEVVIASVVVYAGVGLVMSPSQTAGLKTLPREMNPHGVAIISTLVMVAASIGPSLFIGILSSASAAASASGAGAGASQAAGFSSAVMLAAAIGAAGLALSAYYSLRSRKTAGQPAATEAALSSTPGRPAAAFTLSDAMQHDAFAIDKDASVREVAAVLTSKKTSGIPVIDDDTHVVGFISDGDIMRGLSKQESSAPDLSYFLSAYHDDESFDEKVSGILSANVMDLATTHVVSIDEGASLEDACSILSEKRIKKLPVIREGKLVGSISRSDIVRLLMGEFVSECENA